MVQYSNMMYTKYLLAIVALFIVGVGTWHYSSSSGKIEGDQVPIGQTSSASVEENEKKSFSDFLKQTGAYKCTVEQNVAGAVTSGMVYMNAGKIKGTFASTVNGISVNTSFVLRDGFTYTWTSAYPIGFKAPVSDMSAESQEGVSTQGVYTWNAEDIGAYTCDPWMVDESVFTVPTNVQFMEPGNMGEMLNRFTR